MKILLLSVLILTGCVTFEQEAPVEDVFVRNDIEALQDNIRRLDYFIDHNMCFTTYAVCLGEKKKDSKLCWKEHEACVIRVYKQWKPQQ